MGGLVQCSRCEFGVVFIPEVYPMGMVWMIAFPDTYVDLLSTNRGSADLWVESTMSRVQPNVFL
jgi:hypothetical protein